MRIRLLTGFELTEILQDRCFLFLILLFLVLSFEKKFNQQFELRKKGFSSRENTAARSLFSNMLASIAIQSMNTTTVYDECTTDFQWSLLQSCNSQHCVYSRYSCGFEEGFALLLLSEWDVEIARNFFVSLIFSISSEVSPIGLILY